MKKDVSYDRPVKTYLFIKSINITQYKYHKLQVIYLLWIVVQNDDLMQSRQTHY